MPWQFIFILLLLFFLFLLVDSTAKGKTEGYAVCNPAIKPTEPDSPSYPLNYQICEKRYYYDGF
jgi:hypothetical protein